MRKLLCLLFISALLIPLNADDFIQPLNDPVSLNF